jgi:hypothetical protein
MNPAIVEAARGDRMAELPQDDIDGRAGERMIAWLRARTPDDWHFVGNYLNWDSSMEVVDWILNQSDCEKATAAMMFWRCSPDYYLQYPNREAVAAQASYNVQGFDFASELVSRWNGGFYTRDSLAYIPEPPDAYARYQREAGKYAGQGLPWILDADIGRARHGTDVLTEAEYRRRYSDELARLLYEPGTGGTSGWLKRLFN